MDIPEWARDDSDFDDEDSSPDLLGPYRMDDIDAMDDFDPDETVDPEADPRIYSSTHPVHGRVQEMGDDESIRLGPITDLRRSVAGVSMADEHPGKRARSWCVTINNPQTVGVDNFDFFTIAWPDAQYIVGQIEQGKSGTPHWQVYVQFKNAKMMKTLKRSFGTAHFEVAKGDAKANRKYCTKCCDTCFDSGKKGFFDDPDCENCLRLSDAAWEFGTMPQQGKRTDLDDAVDTLKTQGIRAVANEHGSAFVKYHKGFERLAQMVSVPEMLSPNKRVVLHLGTTGTGKTYDAVTSYPPGEVYVKPPDGHWFDGYACQKLVVWDDKCSGDGVSVTFMLQCLDKYRLQAPVKGAFTWLTCEMCIVTSNQHPWLWYKYPTNENYKAMIRRFDKIVLYRSRDQKLTLTPGSLEWSDFIEKPDLYDPQNW